MKTKSILFVGVIAFLASCGKKWDNDQSALVNYKIETSFDEMTNISDQAITGNLVYYKVGKVVFSQSAHFLNTEKTACNVIITLDTTASPKVLTVDYGTSNCDCNDGKTRRGKIVTTFTGPYLAQGTVITHTPVDYYVNDIKIEGTKKVTNMGTNSSGQPYFNIEIDGTATLTSGTVVDYASTRVRTWVAGYTTLLNRMDDEYDITGTATGVYSSGGGYTANTTAPVRLKVGCSFPSKGTISMTPTGKAERVIDYGDGTCDTQFTVTVNGHTYTFN
jgi:hypothetical protein